MTIVFYIFAALLVWWALKFIIKHWKGVLLTVVFFVLCGKIWSFNANTIEVTESEEQYASIIDN